MERIHQLTCGTTLVLFFCCHNLDHEEGFERCEWFSHYLSLTRIKLCNYISCVFVYLLRIVNFGPSIWLETIMIITLMRIKYLCFWCGVCNQQIWKKRLHGQIYQCLDPLLSHKSYLLLHMCINCLTNNYFLQVLDEVTLII